jgi:hypothetical protein
VEVGHPSAEARKCEVACEVGFSHGLSYFFSVFCFFVVHQALKGGYFVFVWRVGT